MRVSGIRRQRYVAQDCLLFSALFIPGPVVICRCSQGLYFNSVKTGLYQETLRHVIEKELARLPGATSSVKRKVRARVSLTIADHFEWIGAKASLLGDRSRAFHDPRVLFQKAVTSR